MSLSVGHRLGPYEITGSLGAGGMGEVYRARDTRLKRDVALKMLPESFATDADRLARFQREAEVLASLNHPNIAAIYGIEEVEGTRALVMELVEGETLADRIARGPIPVDEALPMARQITEALEAAHEQGIVHRDLKPANIKVRPDGTVKVLDFGLAKALDPVSSASADATASPTITSPALMTGVGVLLGTAAYMAPEQAKGRPAGKQSDVWAFGCVLYEMLTGRRAFPGEDVTDTIAAVVRADPDWRLLPSETPTAIRRVLKRCLQKDPKERLPHIGAARLDIKEALAEPLDQPFVSVSSKYPRSRVLGFMAVVVGMVSIAALVFGAARFLRGPAPLTNVYRSTISPLAHAGTDSVSHLALSPDGRYLAFVAPDADGRAMLWLRPLDGVEAQPLAGTQGAAAPFWSPDSRSLAFIADGKLKSIGAAGGPVAVLCDAEVALPGAWNDEGVILFTPRRSSPLFRVSARGGTPSPATTADSAKGVLIHAFPSFLPDGRSFLYLSQSPNGSNRALEVGSLDSPEQKRLVEGAANAVFAQGHVLFLRDTTLMAQPFDIARVSLTGSAVPVVEQLEELAPNFTGGTSFSVSNNGVLVYRTVAPQRAQLTWFDRAGQQLGVVGEPGPFGNIWLSPDEQQAAVETSSPGENINIRLFDLQRGVSMRLTSDPSDATYPVWSPDGTRLVFTSRRQGLDLYERSAAPGGPETELWSDDLDKFPTSWSPDGLSILYQAVSPDTDADIWILPLAGDRAARTGSARVREGQRPRPLIQTRFAERSSQFSPDGRWIAYQSHESGGPDIFVTRFPDTGSTIRVSSAGGVSPRWRADGRELFFLAPDGSVMAAPVSSDAMQFDSGRPRTLFRLPRIRPSTYPWAISSDGQRFLVNVPEDRQASLTLLVNWPALIERVGR